MPVEARGHQRRTNSTQRRFETTRQIIMNAAATTILVHALEIHRAARPLEVRILRPPPFTRERGSDEEVALSREIVMVAVGAEAFALAPPLLVFIVALPPPRQKERRAAER